MDARWAIGQWVMDGVPPMGYWIGRVENYFTLRWLRARWYWRATAAC